MTKATDRAANPNMTFSDALNAGYCAKGCRTRCDVLGLDWRTFVKHGFPIEDMEHIDDACIARTLSVTRSRLEKEPSE